MSEPEYTGKDVSYYLVDIKTPKRLAPYKAECEDIIEALGMTFAEGCAFKAVWRKCAARTLGVAKAGYKGGLYDAEKAQYYGGRMVAAEERLLVPQSLLTPEAHRASRVGAVLAAATKASHEVALVGVTKRDCPECGAKSPGPHNDGCVYKDHSPAPVELPDMSDPANWLPGDMVMAINSTSNQFTEGMFYELRDHVVSVQDSVRVAKDDTGHPNGWGFYNFIWHSRPAK